LRNFEFDWDRFSVVELGETMTVPHFDCARHDHFDGMLLALYSMESLGYRRIGLAMELMLDVRTRHRWYSAYLLWQSVREYKGQSVLFYENFDIDRISRWIKKNRFDAVISSRNELCDEMREVGFDVSGDVGVAVLDRPAGYPVDLSGINQNVSAIGSAAADMLVNLVRRNVRGIPSLPSQKICGGIWTEGSTTRRVGPPLEGCSLLDRSVVL
jgi:DNA-binding LacI/PurR family transcriptional regulator